MPPSSTRPSAVRLAAAVHRSPRTPVPWPPRRPWTPSQPRPKAIQNRGSKTGTDRLLTAPSSGDGSGCLLACMTVDIRVIRAGQMYRYCLRETVVGDGRRPACTPLREAQEQAGVPAGRWMGRGLTVLGLTPGEEVTEAQLRNLERGRHPYADRIEADLLAKGASPKKAFKAGALGRRVTVTGVEFVLRPQPTIYLLWALGDEETRRVIEAAHERAIERVLAWIEDEVAVIRYGKDGIYRVRPAGGLVAARFRHYEARSGRPLLHDHLLLSVKGQRLDGKWGSIHTTVLHENTAAASALYNEIVAAEVCEALGLATEPRIVTPGAGP
ncbi:MobF family relaxase [Streptomyces olivaceoviridis]|uniref:MobF family relaxase n=1 Tax=Streptomyces olivaceoviridis TaxID=1921 RepID=UPI0036AA2C7D